MSEDTMLVTLKSSDGREFVLAAKAAALSELVAQALNLSEAGTAATNDDDNDTQQEDDDDVASSSVLDIPKVSGSCLENVVEFLNHYVVEPAEAVPSPLPADTLEGCVTQEWYRKFLLRLDRDDTFALMRAANFMDIKPLLDLMTLRITFAICGKPSEYIVDYLKLPPLQNKTKTTTTNEKQGEQEQDNNQ